MANSSSEGEAIMLIIGLALFIFVLYISLYVLGALLALGAVFGGGIGFYNYGQSLRHNINLEKPTR